MNYFKFHSVILAIVVTIVVAIVDVLASTSLSYLIVDTPEELLRNVFLILGIIIVLALLLYLRLQTRYQANYFLTMELNRRIDLAITKEDYTTFMSKDSGQHAARYVHDVSRVLELTFDKLMDMILSGATAVFTLIALINIHPAMFFVALGCMTLMVISPMAFQKKLSALTVKAQNDKEHFLNRIRELMQGYSTFFEHTAFSLFMRKSRKASHAYARGILKMKGYTSVMSATLTFVNFLSVLIAIAILSYLTIRGNVHKGSFLAVFALIPSFGSSLMTLIADLAFYKSGKELYGTKLDLIKDIPSTDSPYLHTCFYSKKKFQHHMDHLYTSFPQTNASKDNIQKIETENLCFHYDDQQIHISDNFHFKKSKKYAIIGESGCGKSSLLKALVGQVTDYTGNILVNGDMKSPEKHLFDQVSYVSQQAFLFNDTIRANITMGHPMTDDEIHKIMSMLHLDQLDPDYLVTENGKNLSGGQRQRIALARALARKKEVLIMDEATANLDPVTAESIEKEILATDAMVIMITHRLTEQNKKQLDAVLALD